MKEAIYAQAVSGGDQCNILNVEVHSIHAKVHIWQTADAANMKKIVTDDRTKRKPKDS